ncbi:MAG: vWA domain-containing protein [Polyangiaceae bacterium]
MTRLGLGVVVVAALAAMQGCGGSDSGGLGFGGSAGAAGAAGAAGDAGNGGNAGNGGSAGDAGSGGSAGSAGVAGTGGSGPTNCSNSLDCVNATGGRNICDPVTELCVQCVVPEDCPENNDCLLNQCVPFTPCVNSLDCPGGQVCDPTSSRCVQCVETADCSDGEVCAGGKCRPACDSDNDCTPLGLLCDRTAGYCVECTKNADCAEDHYCSLGECLADVCSAGYERCQAGGITTCSDTGDSWLPVVACPGSTTCVQAGAMASCDAWVCDPGVTACDSAGEKLEECAADGLSIAKTTDCKANGQVCADDQCRTLACVPDQFSCSGNEYRHCNSDGLDYTVEQLCTNTQYCDVASGCKDQVCTPNQPTCDGDRATTCNAQGSGTNPGGTDCAATGKVCSGGSCVTCAPTTSDAEPLPLDMYLMLDATGSMTGGTCTATSGGTGPWCAQINGVYDFVSNTNSNGIGVALNFWGLTTQCTALSTPYVTYGLLPGNATPILNALNATTPNGSSNTESALRGVIDYTAANTHTGRNMVGVLFSDAFTPNTCELSNTVLAGLMKAHYQATGIPIYWGGINPFNAQDITDVETVLVDSGVSPHSNFCSTHDTPPCIEYDASGDTPGRFEGILNEVARVERLCEYKYPSAVSPTRLSVTYQASGVASSNVVRLPSKTQCGSAPAYYLDDATNPTSITLCPEFCTNVRQATSPKVQAVAACN